MEVVDSEGVGRAEVVGLVAAGSEEGRAEAGSVVAGLALGGGLGGLGGGGLGGLGGGLAGTSW